MRRLPLRSPPRVRGKVCESQGARHDGGSIPAYAGKSHPERRGADQCGDHPRVCGEKCLDGIAHGMIAGSPPRVRGKGPVRRRDGAGMGITPAYAGKSRSCPPCRLPRMDHPRVCGEKDSLHLVAGAEKGSPPRVRGKVADCGNYTALIGITPAYAGKNRSS